MILFQQLLLLLILETEVRESLDEVSDVLEKMMNEAEDEVMDPQIASYLKNPSQAEKNPFETTSSSPSSWVRLRNPRFLPIWTLMIYR